MKTLTTLFLAALLIFGLGVNIYAQGTSTTATASATIIAPLVISKTTDLNFGNVAVNTSLGTVVTTAALPTVRTRTGGVTLPATSGTTTAAKFHVTGEIGNVVNITLPTRNATNPVTITGPSSATMTVDTFTDDGAISGSLHQVTLTGGAADFYVGATLNVAGSQTVGLYTGSFTVSIDYN
jgi:hypothetical protein